MRVMIAGIIIASSVVTAQACGTSELAGDWTFTPGGSDICALEIQSSGAVSGQCTEFRDRQVEGTYRLRGKFALTKFCRFSGELNLGDTKFVLRGRSDDKVRILQGITESIGAFSAFRG